jgi:hypothetical protein
VSAVAVRPICETDPGTVTLSRADETMRRLLRIDGDPGGVTAADAQAAFRTSILVSTVRCLLTYIVLPFVVPAIGLAAGVGPAISLIISAVAIFFLVSSMRRFWRVHHRRRWQYTTLALIVGALLIVGSVFDVASLVS